MRSLLFVPGDSPRKQEKGPKEGSSSLRDFWSPPSRLAPFAPPDEVAGGTDNDLVHRAYNQDGILVAECRRQAMMRKRPVAEA
jgi:hypothetical protein